MRTETDGKRYHSLEAAVKAVFGTDAGILKKERIHGGDINDAYRLGLSGGKCAFVKTNSVKNVGFFLAEAHGLQALSAAGKIGVPKILGTGTDEQRGISFLLLEYIESAPRIKDYWETFGHQLAELHQAECLSFITDIDSNVIYGFNEDNYIGANPQRNLPRANWVEFYRECRLLPQIRMAGRYLDASMRKRLTHLLDHLDTYLREPEFPSLLHGDLWSGNVLCGNDGRAWILDPAVYVGDFEADLAMTQLFGSFPSSFYAAYSEINPIDGSYSDRRDLYHLYHLFNHLNLFGGMYLGSVAEIVRKYV